MSAEAENPSPPVVASYKHPHEAWSASSMIGQPQIDQVRSLSIRFGSVTGDNSLHDLVTEALEAFSSSGLGVGGVEGTFVAPNGITVDWNVERRWYSPRNGTPPAVVKEAKVT